VKLTVVIPSAGRWDELAQTLDALAGVDVVVVVDGHEHVVPASLTGRSSVRFVTVEHDGPAAARNAGAAVAEGELLLFLGDDTIPSPGLVERHLARHTAEPSDRVAVLGRVLWHPRVARRRVNSWLEWSGSQFDYASLEQLESGADVGWGRFYTANVSLKRSLFEEVGGFDTDFKAAAYEDIDFGWRAAELGMALRFEPDAVALHLHPYSLEAARGRFRAVGEAERLMVAKHPWFEPWFYARFERHAGEARASGFWPRIVGFVPSGFERLWWPARAGADRWYHQQLFDDFMVGWERGSDLAELREYLGPEFSLEALWRHTEGIEREAAAIADEGRFYRESRAYLYDLTVFAMSGTKEPYLSQLRRLVAPGGRLLDYGAGIGADGLRLLGRGYQVEFADFDNPSAEFLRWRLARRGLEAPVHDIDQGVPSGFDVAYAFDVIEHVPDPFVFLGELESRAALVVVNLLEPAEDDVSIHHELPIAAIVAHAKKRGLHFSHRYYGRSLLIAYAGDLAASASGGPKNSIGRAGAPAATQ
jgi:GT2 family glycosyltransferase